MNFLALLGQLVAGPLIKVGVDVFRGQAKKLVPSLPDSMQGPVGNAIPVVLDAVLSTGVAAAQTWLTLAPVAALAGGGAELGEAAASVALAAQVGLNHVNAQLVSEMWSGLRPEKRRG